MPQPLVLGPDGTELVNRKSVMSQVGLNCPVTVEERLTPAAHAETEIDASQAVFRSRSGARDMEERKLADAIIA